MIKKVVKGGNITGKVFAIKALLTLNLEGTIVLSKEEKLEIQMVINSDLPIRVCLGSEYEEVYLIDLFRRKDLKALSTKNGLKINYL